MNDASSIFRGSHLIASIKHRPYDTVVDSEELLDYSHYDKSGIKMFNETQPFFCDWNYSQHFPNSANILNNWSSYHLASNDDQSSECRTNNLILDRCAFNPKSISESNSLDSWFPDMLKQSPNNSHQSNVSATAAVETDFIGSFVNTLQETPKVGSSVYPFQVLEQQQVESKPNYPGDFKSERTHQCVQCSRYYASIGGLKRHIKVCRISSADSQPLFNSLNQLNTISIPAPQLSSGNNSLPVDLSLVGTSYICTLTIWSLANYYILVLRWK